MKPRKIPGGLALGLFASLGAHAVLYGGNHPVGGVSHALLMQITAIAALGFVALVGALALTQAASSTDSSLLAARLREGLPGVGSVVASAAAWYFGVEALEPHHVGAPVIALLAVLAAASYFILRLADAMTDAFARVATAMFHTSFSSREPARRRFSRGRLIPHQSFLTRRRFARPPPVAFAFPRA